MGRKSLGMTEKEYQKWYYQTKGKFKSKKPQNPEYAATYRQKLRSKGFFVYLYFDLDTSQAIYVGKGRYYRPHVHKFKSWYKPSLLLLTMSCTNEWEALEYEGKWGGCYLPVNNFDGNRK